MIVTSSKPNSAKHNIGGVVNKDLSLCLDKEDRIVNNDGND